KTRRSVLALRESANFARLGEILAAIFRWVSIHAAHKSRKSNLDNGVNLPSSFSKESAGSSQSPTHAASPYFSRCGRQGAAFETPSGAAISPMRAGGKPGAPVP